MCVEVSIDLVDLLYRVSKEEREKHKRSPSTYWITDLLRCTLKRDYELRYPELSESEVFMPFFIVGTLVHRGLQGLLREVMPNDISTEVEREREIVLPNGEVVCVSGRADILIKVGEELVGVEIKTSRSDLGLPKQHHVDQARMYNWLFNLKRTILIYVSPDRVTQYVIEDSASNEEVVERVISRKIPRYEWECKYCIYSVMCPYKIPSR